MTTIPSTNCPPVALLEDDPVQSAWTQTILLEGGLACDAFGDGNELLAALRARRPYELLLLDWELPGISGLEVLQWVRAHHTQQIPVIFVTQRGDEHDLVQGLNAGADDYICKPPRAAELLARIGALLRRQRAGAAPAEPVLETGVFTIDFTQRTIHVQGSAVALTRKEFDLATLFLRNPSRLFSRDDLSTLVWNREVPATSRTLDTHLSNIRRKLRFGPPTGTLLNASYALGYRLDFL